VNGSLEDRVRERTLALEDAIRRSELSRSDLEAANRELNAFTVSVSHDLRGPLTIISGYARAFLDHYSQRLDDTGRGLISNVIWGCDRMNHLINSLLRLARFSQAEMRFETVDLTALAWESIQEARELSDARLVEVQIEDGMIVSGDQEMLRVAIDNLVRNAWKFTRKRPDAEIRIGQLHRDPDPDGKKVFFIRDNGVGFESGQADTLFKAFHRLHSTSEFEGTGIGLATVERIVLRHGGYAWAEGAVDQGACIYFAL
jgi:signal transduction histidine kinase